MHITYDPEHNVGYIRLSEKSGKVSKTLVISGDLNIDMASDGTIYGIELLNANEQLRGDTARIVLENQQTNVRQELSL